MSTRDLYALFGAEALQQPDEQAEADGWTAIAGFGLACFAAGAIFTTAAAWVWSLFL